MPDLVAIYGSPRKDGNTSTLLKHTVDGAKTEGAKVREFVLRDMKLSPCLEIYGCKKDGRCVIKDDFQQIADAVLASRAVILASPIFFYTVSAHTKIFMDRCQSLWVKKYWLDEAAKREPRRVGLFISAGATRGKKLFDGALLSVRYLFDVLEAEPLEPLLYRGLDEKGAVLEHPEYLEQAKRAGAGLARAVRERWG
ncbi:MAG: flavodoxin family protein [Deltaproteobacteria bacterium]|nr:flavodoxin family protein [Deltaproteobacteria bacterium]